MRTAGGGIALFLSCSTVFAQRPTDPALLVPATAPARHYVPAPKAFDLPDGVTMGAPASVAFDSKGHMFVLTRGDKLFTRAHGLRIDRDDNLWATDVGANGDVFTADGAFVREIHYAGLPCGLKIGRRSIFMVNGYAGQLLELDLDSKVVAALGNPGTGLGEFGEAHMIAVSPKGDLYVADTVNATLTKFTKDK